MLYSVKADKYYVGYSSNPQLRVKQHNGQDCFNTYTSKFRPWELMALFECGEKESTAMELEKFIKKQHSRKLIEQLLNPDFIPTGKLAQLVRVPQLRD